MKTVNVKSLGQCPYLISLEPCDLIGRGSYAQVCKAYNQDDPGQKLAAKIFDLNDANKFESGIKQLVVVSKIPYHINLVEYKKVKITSKKRLYIIMQECQISLQQKLDHLKTPLNEDQIWQIVSQICQGYKILQQKSIIHRDIKPDNILIGFDKKYKISDFGLSDIINGIQKDTNKTKGSLPFIAPQLLLYPSKQGLNITSIIDSYSLGVTIFNICYRIFPYLEYGKFQISFQDFRKQIAQNYLYFPETNIYSKQLKSLMRGCLEKQPNKRYTWEFIYLTLLQRKLTTSKTKINLISQNQHQKMLPKKQNTKFRIVQISDAFLKNLSALDGDLYSSLSRESILIIDHVQASIISKRQTIFFCDRLYYRLEIIKDKLIEILQLQKPRNMDRQKKTIDLLEIFCYNFLVFNYLKCRNLDLQFEEYYAKIDNYQLLKCVASQKYKSIRALIKQDLTFLGNTLQEQEQQKGSQQLLFVNNFNLQSKLQQYQVQVYERCWNIIMILYQFGYNEECKQLDELEKYLSGAECRMKTFRTNENALKQFDLEIQGLSKQKLWELVDNKYIHSFRSLDLIKNEIEDNLLSKRNQL